MPETPMTEPYWARLRFSGPPKRWHLVSGLWSICGCLSFDYPRVERAEGLATPAKGKLCKHCVAKALRLAREQREPCLGNDPLCPCQDGDMCHYRGPDAWPVPKSK